MLREFLADKTASEREKAALQSEISRLRQSGEFKDLAIANFLTDLGEEPGKPNSYPYRLGVIASKYRELVKDAQIQSPRIFRRISQQVKQLKDHSSKTTNWGVRLYFRVEPYRISHNELATLTVGIDNLRVTELYNVEIYIRSLHGLVKFDRGQNFIIVHQIVRSGGKYVAKLPVTTSDTSVALTDEIIVVATYYDATSFDRSPKGPPEELAASGYISIA